MVTWILSRDSSPWVTRSEVLVSSLSMVRTLDGLVVVFKVEVNVRYSFHVSFAIIALSDRHLSQDQRKCMSE